MASCIPGSLVADVRGSVGTETFSRTLGGLIVKARSNPGQPASAKRDRTQANFTSVSQGWSGRLSAGQRDAWRTYGVRYPRPNRWGNMVIDSGYLAFVRCNCALKTISTGWWIDVPPERGMLPMPIFTLQAIFVGIIVWQLTLDASYIPVDDDWLCFAYGKTTNVGVAYYSSPWQGHELWWYDEDAWTPVFEMIAAPGWCGANDRFWGRAYVINAATGRLSVHFQTSCLVDFGKGFVHHPPGWFQTHPVSEWLTPLP